MPVLCVRHRPDADGKRTINAPYRLGEVGIESFLPHEIGDGIVCIFRQRC
jgi:hypothetical protein